jgi:hypothetical protein
MGRTAVATDISPQKAYGWLTTDDPSENVFILHFWVQMGDVEGVAKTDLGSSSPGNWFTPKCGISKKRPIYSNKGSYGGLCLFRAQASRPFQSRCYAP